MTAHLFGYQGIPGGPSDPATPGGYCLARCYCGTCPQYAEQTRRAELARQQDFDARIRKEDEERRGQRPPSKRRRSAASEAPADAGARGLVLEVIGRFVDRGEPFSANDARPLLPDGIPAGVLGNCWATAVRRHNLREIGRVPSTDPNTNAHKIPVWSVA